MWHRPKPNKGENPTPVGDASLSVAQSPLRQTIRAYPAKYKPSRTSATDRTQEV